jgi:PAS domain-containing protein
MSPLGAEEIAGLGLEQVARDAPVAIAVIDAAGQVIYSNGRARELTSRQLGSEPAADLDRAIDILHPDGRRYERDEWPAVRSITSGEEMRRRASDLHADGEAAGVAAGGEAALALERHERAGAGRAVDVVGRIGRVRQAA